MSLTDTTAVPATLPGTSTAETASASKLTPVQEAKLRKAAGDFESILLSTFWKSMKDSFKDEDDESTDPAHDTLDDMGMQAMSSAVGKVGGLGLGKLLLKHIAPGLDAHAAENLHVTTKPLQGLADKNG